MGLFLLSKCSFIYLATYLFNTYLRIYFVYNKCFFGGTEIRNYNTVFLFTYLFNLEVKKKTTATTPPSHTHKDNLHLKKWVPIAALGEWNRKHIMWIQRQRRVSTSSWTGRTWSRRSLVLCVSGSGRRDGKRRLKFFPGVTRDGSQIAEVKRAWHSQGRWGD